MYPIAGFHQSLREDFLRAAESCFATTMRIVPHKYRFAVLLVIARFSVPVFRKTNAYREQAIKKFHSPYEISLHLVLNALTKNGVTFDPIMSVNGYEECERAHEAGKGVLVIGHHAALTLLMVRFLYDKGLDPIVVTPDQCMRVGGRKDTVRTVQPSATFLVKIRTRLRRGEIVCAMPDRAEPHGERTFDFDIPGGRLIVAPAMIQIAARCGAEVIFAEVHAEGRRLVGTIAAPSGNSAATGGLTDDFIAFVKASTCSNREIRT